MRAVIILLISLVCLVSCYVPIRTHQVRGRVIDEVSGFKLTPLIKHPDDNTLSCMLSKKDWLLFEGVYLTLPDTMSVSEIDLARFVLVKIQDSNWSIVIDMQPQPTIINLEQYSFKAMYFDPMPVQEQSFSSDKNLDHRFLGYSDEDTIGIPNDQDSDLRIIMQVEVRLKGRSEPLLISEQVDMHKNDIVEWQWVIPMN